MADDIAGLIERLRHIRSPHAGRAADALSRLSKRVQQQAIEKISLAAQCDEHVARIAELENLAATLKQQAQIHAQEARAANSTIAEIYQVVTGSTGEPGNWNGAEPVRQRIADLESKLAARESASPVACIYEWETPFGLHRDLQYGTYNGSWPHRYFYVYTRPPVAADITLSSRRERDGSYLVRAMKDGEEVARMCLPAAVASELICCQACGDGITVHDPGICGTCYAVKYRDRPAASAREEIRALQKALAYWMPSVFDERSGHDAFLLAGYEGPTEDGWGERIVKAAEALLNHLENVGTTWDDDPLMDDLRGCIAAEKEKGKGK